MTVPDEAENVGPAPEPDAVKELLTSGVKISHGRLFIEWAEEA